MRRRSILSLLTTAALALAPAAAAHATDLLVLEGESATLSGSNDFGIVYVDGELRLTGDTTINAASVYIGPNAWLRPCYVAATDDDSCPAGRSLTIHSASTLTIEPALDLTGHSGTARAGGALALSGTDVAVGGAITTAGNGGPSGPVTIAASGLATTGPITAYGAPVSITAARNVSVNGDIQTQGAAQVPAPSGRLQPAAPVTIGSSGGDVAVRGTITASGRDAGAGQGPGGIGADVALAGGDVRVGAIDTTGGSSVDADPGPSGAIALAARGALHALGRLDASGAGSTNGTATPGMPVSAMASGPLTLAGGVAVGGGSSPAGGGAAGRLSVEGGSVAIGTISANGGSATASGTPHDATAGGTVAIRSHGATSLGTITAAGGNAPAGGHAGPGGSVTVTGQSISAGVVTTSGGTVPAGPGADGGPVALDADGSLALGGALTASGSNANGAAATVYRGGSAGSVFLRAADGMLDLGAPVWAQGGRGSANSTAGSAGGAGGAGGPITLVARTLGTIVAIVARGGDGGGYGDTQGPGGAGGAIHGFTDGPLLDDLKVVSADGGDGNPTGLAGARTVEASPTALALSPAGRLTFTSRSPGASAFRIQRSVGGAPAEVLTTTGATSVAVPGPMCVPVTVTVVAVNDGVRWTSDAPASVGYTPQPSPTQRCSDPPAIKSVEKKLRRKLETVRKQRWKLTVKLTSGGLGHLDAALLAGKKKLKTIGAAAMDVKPGRPPALKFRLPKAQQHAGKLKLRLVATAPDGSHKATTTIPVEVLRK